jgi:SecD/SecF fusion protein
MPSFHIDFMGKRKYMFALSAVLLVVAIGSLAFRGLTFGIEFSGGTEINIVNSGSVTIEQVRSAFDKAGQRGISIQSSAGDTNGFIIRTDLKNAEEAQNAAAEVAKTLNLPESSFQVTTIGPGWGKNVTDRATMALALSIAAILLYVSIRFEYKMSVAAVVALVHDVAITLGIYSLFGQEVTPNTVAAILTILGYSLYDTVVTFHRIKENSQRLAKQSFMSMANDSINQVLVRTINTSVLSLMPVLVMLFFGGETLYDFALALTIGLLIGVYSSFGVATPIYVLWKEVEPKFAALKKKYA